MGNNIRGTGGISRKEMQEWLTYLSKHTVLMGRMTAERPYVGVYPIRKGSEDLSWGLGLFLNETMSTYTEGVITTMGPYDGVASFDKKEEAIRAAKSAAKSRKRKMFVYNENATDISEGYDKDGNSIQIKAFPEELYQ